MKDDNNALARLDESFGSGGAIHVNSKSIANVKLQFDSCNFARNSARDGGAVHVSSLSNVSHSLDFNDCEFVENSASYFVNGGPVNRGSGGAVFADCNHHVTLLNSHFVQNTVFATHYSALCLLLRCAVKTQQCQCCFKHQY